MSMVEDDFNKCLVELYNISEVVGDDWKLNEKHQKFYLSKKQTIVLSKSNANVDDDEDVNEDPAAAAVKCHDNDVISMEYHVLHHPSYQVPSLMFLAHYSGEFNL